MRERSLATHAPQIVVAHARVPGRLRLRCTALRHRPAEGERLRAALLAQREVRKAEVRTPTGSVIVAFREDVEHARMADLVTDLAQRVLSGESPAEPPPRTTDHAAPGREPGWHSLGPDEVAEGLSTDVRRGLTRAEAEARLRRHGANMLPHEKAPSRLSLLLSQINSLPVAMLGASSIVSFAAGRPIESAATLVVVAANAALGYVTEEQAEASIAALTGSAGQQVLVIRDGTAARIRSADLVPGDILVVRAGTQVMADARLIEADRMKVDQSALTGETISAPKSVDADLAETAPIGEQSTMIHSGTLVTQGAGRAIVVATGAGTEAARIALLSQSGRRPQAPVEAELETLGRGLTAGALAASGVFVAAGLARGYPVREIVNDALALAVAAVPEGLPVVATTTMALALRRMERKGILIRHIRAVEGLGAVHTVCLDKTGTLTENRMCVVGGVAGMDAVDMTDVDALREIAEAAALNCSVEKTGDRATAHSSTEQALVDFAVRVGFDVFAIRDRQPRTGTVERGDERPWMATHHDGPGPRTIVKGAPESVLRMCARMRTPDGDRELTQADREQIILRNDALAAQPARVLGFARSDGTFDEQAPGGLTWLGSLGMADPLRPGARTFVRRMQRAGIETVMITGDQAATAVAIARDLGLGRDGSVSVMDSTEISRIDPALLAGLVRRTDVFARVSAHQKLAIVKALQASGRVVAMTGDGINDGPALRAADIGIAMGDSGTDLARDVANVVVRDDRLETLAEAVAEGRAVYRNIRRSLGFLITTNMSEILVELVEALHGKGEVETPMELLWINMVTDILPGLGLAMAAPDPDAMHQPPRNPDEPIMRRSDYRRMVLDGATISAAALVPHFVGLARHGPGPQTRGMTFLSLALGQLLYTIVAQRRDIADLRVGTLLQNRALDGALLASTGLAVLPFVLPGLGRILGVARLRPTDMALSLAFAAAPTAVVLGRRGLGLELGQIERDG